MIVTQIECAVPEEKIPLFIQTSKTLYAKLIQEPGVIRIDILQAKLLPTQFLLYLAFASEDASNDFRRSDFWVWFHANPGISPSSIDTYICAYHRKFDPLSWLPPRPAGASAPETPPALDLSKISIVVVDTLSSGMSLSSKFKPPFFRNYSFFENYEDARSSIIAHPPDILILMDFFASLYWDMDDFLLKVKHPYIPNHMKILAYVTWTPDEIKRKDAATYGLDGWLPSHLDEQEKVIANLISAIKK